MILDLTYNSFLFIYNLSVNLRDKIFEHTSPLHNSYPEGDESIQNSFCINIWNYK